MNRYELCVNVAARGRRVRRENGVSPGEKQGLEPVEATTETGS